MKDIAINQIIILVKALGLNMEGITQQEKETIIQKLEHLKQVDVNPISQLPKVEHGSFLVYCPRSFPKNSRWVVAEYKDDVKGFYSESSEIFLEDATHWCELPKEPKP